MLSSGRKRIAKVWTVKSVIVSFEPHNGTMEQESKQKLDALLNDEWEPFTVLNIRPTMLTVRTREIWLRRLKDA